MTKWETLLIHCQLSHLYLNKPNVLGEAGQRLYKSVIWNTYNIY